MPTLGLKLSPDAWLYRVASGAPYVPNYPPGLSGISGLVGWYDSSASSTVVVDGSSNVTRWKNYWNGATQGATVLPDFVPPSTSNYATQVTGQSYIYGQSSGSHVGISFDGAASEMQLENNIPSSLSLNNVTLFVALKMLPNNFPLPVGFDVVDSGLNDVVYTGNYTGNNLLNIIYQSQNNGATVGYGENGYVQMLSLSPTGFAGIAQMVIGYIETASGGGDLGKMVYYYTPSGVTPRATQTQALALPTVIGNTSLPWTQITLGSDYLNSQGGTYGIGPALIGEILVYNNLPNQTNAATIAEYLRAKWA
jgi:hypothetical protein